MCNIHTFRTSPETACFSGLSARLSLPKQLTYMQVSVSVPSSNCGFTNRWRGLKKSWPLLLTSFKTCEGRESFPASCDHSLTFLSEQTNHSGSVTAESTAYTGVRIKKNEENVTSGSIKMVNSVYTRSMSTLYVI